MSEFNNIVILGRQPEFGLVELESVLGAAGVAPFGRQAALAAGDVDVARLGGAVKAGRVLYHGPKFELRDAAALAEIERGLTLREGKTPFAVSVYGPGVRQRDVMALGLELKKRLRSRGSVRLVAPGSGTAVNAAELKHNRVLESGFELLFVRSGTEMVVALTTGVQNVDWYSARDYGRPARSARVGMLPPKLAQVLVNATQAAVVADPFCGTGVVLAEAMLAGRSAHGSDLAPEMVAASRKNLEWLQSQLSYSLPVWSVAEADARSVELPADCAVVSEGYLGPNMAVSPTPDRLPVIVDEVLALYKDSLTNWAEQLPAGAEVSLCVPAWRVGSAWCHLGLIDELPGLGYTLKSFDHVRAPLLYAREGQVVGRQILFLRKA